MRELQIQHSSLRQQIGDKLQNLQKILPEIIQQHTTKQNYGNMEYSYISYL